MNYSLSYQNPRASEADEIRAPFNQLGLVLRKYPEKRINIKAPEEELSEKFYEQVNAARSSFPSYTISTQNLPKLRELLNLGYEAYLDYPVSDWETFSQLVSLGVSDIYIDGPLGFSNSDLSLGKKETRIRVSPQVSPNASLFPHADSSFFIRPEDLSLYSAIDYIDFHEPSIDKEEALFSIYTRGSFIYNLNQLSPSLPNAPNLYIRPEFAQDRLNCGNACSRPSRSCHLCESEIILAQQLETYMKYRN